MENKKLLVIPCLTLFFILFYIYFEIPKNLEAKNITFLNKSEAPELKIILLWNSFFRNSALGLW